MSDNNFFQRAAHYIPVLELDVSACEDAINNNSMPAIVNAGEKMVSDSSIVKNMVEPIEVSDQVQVLKDLFIELIEALIQAGNSLHNVNVDNGKNQLQNAKQKYNDFKAAVDQYNPSLLAQK